MSAIEENLGARITDRHVSAGTFVATISDSFVPCAVEKVYQHSSDFSRSQ